jgi:hypothetical protein
MKKLLVVLLALAVVGMVVSAEAKLSVGGWGRIVMSPVASNGTDSQVIGASASWGGGGRVGVSFNGSSDNVGFAWNPGVNGSTMNPVCDQAKIFAKVNDMLTVQLGVIQGDVLRGKLDDFGDILPVSGKDAIFNRFNPQAGILLDITPAPGIYLGVALDGPSGGAALAKDAYKAIQIGAGYTIEGVGLVRAQFIGKTGVNATTGKDEVGIFNAAFAYTGMEGLTVDAGFKYNLESKQQMNADVGAAYGKDALAVYGRVDAAFGGDSDLYQLNLKAAGQLVYTVADPLALGAEVAFAGMSAAKLASGVKDTKTVDVYPFVKLGYSNGYLKVGFDAKVGLDGQDLIYALPVQLEYWF